jgi:hypothetical protein
VSFGESRPPTARGAPRRVGGVAASTMTAADDGTRSCRHELVPVPRGTHRCLRRLPLVPWRQAVSKGFRPEPSIKVIRYAALFHVEQQTGRVAMGSLHERLAGQRSPSGHHGPRYEFATAESAADPLCGPSVRPYRVECCRLGGVRAPTGIAVNGKRRRTTVDNGADELWHRGRLRARPRPRRARRTTLVSPELVGRPLLAEASVALSTLDAQKAVCLVESLLGDLRR